MAANTQPIFPLAPKNPSGSIANADGQTVKAVMTAGANGSRVNKLTLVSIDTVSRDIGIYVGGVLIGTIIVPALAGTVSGNPAIDVFADPDFKSGYYDAAGNKVIDLAAAAVLGINAPVTLTAAKTVTGVALGADY